MTMLSELLFPARVPIRRWAVSRRAMAGASAAAALISLAMFFPPFRAAHAAPPAKTPAVQNPTLRELIQALAAWERAYLPYQFKVRETYRYSEDLSPEQRTRHIQADGRKHERLMEYAQLASRVWRKKETHLVDDEPQRTGPWQSFSDGERVVQQYYQDTGEKVLNRVFIQSPKIKGHAPTYLTASPVYGVFCLAGSSGAILFSEAFPADKENLELAWDKGDAKLTFIHGPPQMKQRFVLWLSRDHAWHPMRLQRYWGVDDKLFNDEWEVTKFVQRGKQWRVAAGTHRFRDADERELPDAKVIYALDFKVLEEKYGKDVDEKQFKFEIPADAEIRRE